VLVRAIAYSGLPHWKELLSTFADRMPMRHAMIDKYLAGKLPTLSRSTTSAENAGRDGQDAGRAAPRPIRPQKAGDARRRARN
jgi:hypothetical protein